MTPNTPSTSSDFADGVRVTRAGFEFHICYRTRFGENKTEKLEAALESFQRMRAFKPHINIQKSGIRLVVTRWDGDNFLEEHGIENLEHASPEQVENLIRSNLLGGAEEGQPQTGGAGSSRIAKGGVVHVGVVRKPSEMRCHLVFQRQNGTTEQGPLLIRPNLARLAAEGIFRPDVSISMTALSDRIIIEQDAPSGTGRSSETLPLDRPEDLGRVEAVLNSCLSKVTPLASVPMPSSILPGPTRPKLNDADQAHHTAKAAQSEPTGNSKPEPLLVPTPPVLGAEASAPPPASEPPAKLAKPTPPKVEPTPELLVKAWGESLFKAAEGRPPEEVNGEIFVALRERFSGAFSSNDHGFPAFEFECPNPAGDPVRVELVHTNHYLLCNFPFGYARFGLEARFFLTRLDDFVAYPQDALRGAVEDLSTGVVSLIVTDGCVRFLQSHGNYRTHFETVLQSANELRPNQRLIWPISQEDRLFQKVASTAKSYGLPVTPDRIVLDPNAPVFVGFVKVAPHGMEFRDGDDYARFTPVEFELNDEGTVWRFAGTNVIRGWGLDAAGHVCAIYREASGFHPPHQTKLLRFLSEEEKDRPEDPLTLLAFL